MKRNIEITEDNIFADLGLEDADEMVMRSDLMSEVVKIIRKSGLPQVEIAKILGVSAPKISALMTGKINDFSNDTLMSYLTMLGCNLEIRLSPPRRFSKTSKKGFMKLKRTTVWTHADDAAIGKAKSSPITAPANRYFAAGNKNTAPWGASSGTHSRM
ncbi:MAG TPA: helix-turn-helix transcriptional regulator [Rhabdochlamydiaceae bacterium]|nr:helix-turn-helix transcriptional regulator [Rhabdochlamydiaceae bacterium]HSX38652.1 helix-turn-helix transcriptional regulator [Chlamydiales bacterium]